MLKCDIKITIKVGGECTEFPNQFKSFTPFGLFLFT